MPLHLLPKKSWHVYNSESIARVKRDEAAAEAHEEALEQAQQEVDSARRIALLRGEGIPPHLQQHPSETKGDNDLVHRQHVDPRKDDVEADAQTLAPPRKRRRRHGEDDTQAEMRFAREDLAAGEAARARFSIRTHNGGVDGDAPLVDDAGHLQLFSAPKDKGGNASDRLRGDRGGKTKSNEQDQEDQGMRFRDAAGRSASGDPWYTTATAAAGPKISSGEQARDKRVVLAALQEKDVWGNEDPRRRERETQRLATGDPFSAMQSAQRQLKQSTHDREKWQRERMATLDAEEEERQRRHRRNSRRERHESRGELESRAGDGDEDDLESFRLDEPPLGKRLRDDRSRSHHHQRHHQHTKFRRRSRSRSHERHRHRKHHEVST